MNTVITKRLSLFSRSLLALGLIGGVAFAAESTIPQRQATVPDSVVQPLKEQSAAFAAIEKVVSPAVVSIVVEKTVNGPVQMRGVPFNDGDSPFNDEFFRRFFGDKGQFRFREFTPQKQSFQQTASGQGSGFIVSSDGDILTNNHVIADADKVTVQLQDGRSFKAKVVGSDSHTDVAVLRIKATGLPSLSLGDSDQLQVGEWVLASGAPFGLTHTLTAGIVSAKGRSSVGITDYENFIQTDAAINPGNSGGPLLNLHGQVVGMNTAIFSRSGGSMGVGFAIPVNMVRQVYAQIIAHGSVQRAYLGVMIQQLTPDLADSFGVKNTNGALIGEVRGGTPGAKAGLKEGDIVTAINGKRYDDVGRFRNAIALMSPGANVDLTVLRDGKELHLTATLDQLPDSEQLASTSGPSVNDWGFAVQPLTTELAEQLGLRGHSGIVISNVKSRSLAERANLKPGMLIERINRQNIETMKDFHAAMETAKSDHSLLLLVSDGQTSRFVVLRSAS